ncbi:hypothetical protein Barb4_04548 [Bacteroidales bacterium Barb4]|nr:hypothetical protein Barb4_04548 [Bacteroidales bacterium Barb4]
MRERHFVQLVEGDAVQSVSHVEGTVAHVVQLQVRAHLIFVQVKLRLLGFLEVIAPVPGFGFKVAALLADFGLDVSQFGFGFG